MQGISYMLDSTNKATDTKELESHIDSLVYKLYHLTDDEIKIIERKQIALIQILD